MAAPVVLVTGATGFIATHIIQQLQQAGHKVRGTVRNVSNEAKIKPLKELCPDAKFELELVEADLLKSEGWVEAVQGCTFVLHTASPFPDSNPRDEMEVIGPAVDGTLNILKACKEAGGVKRVVLTSSVVAVSDGFTPGSNSEENWTDVEKASSTYIKSKTLAEKAAWDFVAEIADGNRFELAVINPSFVIGPVLCGGWATSMTVPKRLLEREMPALPRLSFPMIDVRDVAKAHVIAMTSPEAAGKRHILSREAMWFKEMADILAEEFKPLGYNVPQSVAPYCIVKILSLCDKALREVLPGWNKTATYDNTRMVSVLGIEPRPMKHALIEMAYSMIEKGFIKKTNKYKQIKEAQP